MKHRVPHALDDNAARRTIDRALSGYVRRFARYRASVRWLDSHRAAFAFEIKGRQVHGHLILKPRCIELEVHVPWAFRMFVRRATARVDAELRRLLGEAQDRHAYAHGC